MAVAKHLEKYLLGDEISDLTKEYIQQESEEKIKDSLDSLDFVIKTRLKFGEKAFTNRWHTHGILDWLTPEEASVFLEKIQNWSNYGVRLKDLETTIDEDGHVVTLHYNLEKVN